MFLLFLWLPSWWCQDTMIRWYLKKYSSFVTLIRIQHSNQICSILNFETTHTHTHCLLLFFGVLSIATLIRITIWPLWFVSFLSDDVSQLWRDSLGPGEAKAFASLLTRKSQPELPRMRFGRKLALQVQGAKGGKHGWHDTSRGIPGRIFGPLKGGKLPSGDFFRKPPNLQPPNDFLRRLLLTWNAYLLQCMTSVALIY